MKLRFLIIVLFSVFYTNAQSLSLDPTFGTNGISLGPVTTQYPFRMLFEDNKYFIILTSNGGVVSKNYDGSLNTSFGTNGRKYFNAAGETITIFGTKFDNGYIYIFGKIAGGTNTTDNGFIVKMSTTGTLDSSFGGTGKAIFDFGASESINDIQFTNSGIYAVGTKSVGGMFLAKITSAGNLDTSFDAVGYKTYEQNSEGLGVYSLGTDLLICGTTYSNSTGYITAWKVDQDGNLITGYGTNGKKEVVYKPPTDVVSYYFKSSKLDPNGNLLIHYDYQYSFIDRGSRLVKFNLSTNTLENFIYLNNYYQDYYVDNNNKVYTTGSSDCGPSVGQCNRIFFLKRTNYNATADLSFNNTGFFSYKISPVQSYGEDLSTSFYFHDDGKIVMAGYGVAIDYGMEMLRLVSGPLITEEFVNKNTFSIFPNPAYEEINISSIDNKIISEIAVFDIYGKQVVTRKGNISTFNIKNLQQGLYFLKIKTEDAESVLKFIKK